MTEESKEIWEYKAREVREFFLSNAGYFNFDMPLYIDFDKLLKRVHSRISDIDSRFQGQKNFELRKKLRRNEKAVPGANNQEGKDVNYTLFINKDNKYTWRPYKFIHPALYVALAHELTKEGNWKLICDRFKVFSQNKRIRCYSLPVPVAKGRKSKAQQINRWVDKVEQQSIELSLEYNYLMRTDISNCYNSIYTHSIAWAIHDKEEARKEENRQCPRLLGNVIDRYMQDMNQGKTNGISQGSGLTDFIAEIVLGYLDLQLSNKIAEVNAEANRDPETDEREKIEDYKILRFRDDYRIFVNNKEVGERITRLLAEAAVDLGFSLNPAKTELSEDVIRDSIKPDKLAWMAQKRGAKSLQKHLLIIHNHSRKFPNSGSLIRPLQDYYRRIDRLCESSSRKEGGLSAKDVRKSVIEYPRPIISIVVDIAYNNPRTYPICAVILGTLISFIDDRGRKEILEKIRQKFEQIPKSGHLEVWLQRISHNEVGDIAYGEKICEIVSKKYTSIWDTDWLGHGLQSIIEDKDSDIIDRDKLGKTRLRAPKEETDIFADGYY